MLDTIGGASLSSGVRPTNLSAMTALLRSLAIVGIIALVQGLYGADARHNNLPKGTQVIELPRPNSGTFTFEQAAARKDEILSNVPSKRLDDYKRPYMGFSVHVESDDTFTVYAPFPEIDAASFPRVKQTVAQIMELDAHTLMYGNPHGILITSERSLKESKTIQALLKAIHVPSIQIFYLSTKAP